MSRIIKLLIILVFIVGSIQLANANGSLLLLGVGGAGGGGFLPISTANFALTNMLPSSGSMASGTTWTPAASGATAPSVATVSATLPDGTTGNVSQVTFSPVSGASHYAVLDQPGLGSINADSATFGFWAQYVSGGGNGTLYATMSFGTTFVRAAIPNTDTAWHLVTVSFPAATFANTASPAPQIGVNLFDGGQTATTGTAVVNFIGLFAVKNPYASLIAFPDINGPLATTTAAVTGSVTKPLPTHVRFRDFSTLTPSPSNPILSENPSEIWSNGGVSNPFISQFMQSGGFFWAFSNCTSSRDHTAWMSFCLFKSTDALTWTEDTTNAPYLQMAGSVFANPTVAAGGSGFTASASGVATWTGTACPTNPQILVTTNSSGVITTATPDPNNGVGTGACPLTGIANAWPNSAQTTWSYTGLGATTGAAAYNYAGVRGTGSLNFFQLHPAWLPFGCNVSGTPHNFCILFSGSTSGQSFATYLAWADAVNGVYTLLGCSSTPTCASPTQVLPFSNPTGSPGGNGGNNVVSVVNVGGINGTNMVYTAQGGLGGPNTSIWSTPANPATTGAGSTLTYNNIGFLPKASGVDWDYANGSTAYQDNFVFYNHCGFYEYFYAATNSSGFGALSRKTQLIGYAVSNSPNGPWYKYNIGPIIPGTSSMYFGTSAIGDSAVVELNGNLIWTGNFDDGEFTSRAVAATMPQGTCP